MQMNKKMHTKFFLLVLIFILPAIISWFLYSYHEYFQFKTVNHGVLVKPPIDADYLGIKKKWRIIYISDKSCAHHCIKINYQLNQVRKALGSNRERVNVIRLAENDIQLEKLKHVFLQQNENFTLNNKIYLIDPAGNLFMYYPSTINPMDILQDLKRLLEVSQIG